MLTTLDHAVIAVRDLAAATETYTKLLGRRPSWQGVHPAYGTANTLYRLDNAYLELLAPRAEGTIAERLDAWLAKRGEGLFGLAFGTADAEKTARELRVRGLDASEPIDGSGKDAASGAERCWRNVMLDETRTRGVTLFAIEHRSPASLLPIAEPLEDPGSAVSGFDHVVVQTTDPDRAAELYGEKLGLRLTLDREFPDWGYRLIFFQLGGIILEIAAPLAAQAVDAVDRLWGIAYGTSDIEAAHRGLLRRGVDVSEVRLGHKPGTRVFSVQGEPCGVPTLVITHE